MESFREDREYRSYKWISTGLVDGVRRLDIHDSTKPVFGLVGGNKCNIISIFGRARQGKSFLMNCLAGERDIFKVSNEKEPCTEGIDISDKWVDLRDFSRIDGGKYAEKKSSMKKIEDELTSSKIKVGFVDAEGQGDKNITYDATLVCPILLISKCVIFNWKGDIQKDHLLETLGIMAKAAKNVVLDVETKMVGQRLEQASNGRAKFSHLHIVFRDWQAADSNVEAVYRIVFDVERTPEAYTRDRIRQEVLASFASIRIWLFDAPTDSVQSLKERLTLDMTTENFRQQVRALRGALSAQLRDPLLFGGQSLTGKNIGPVISNVAAALNKGEAVMPQSAFVGMIRTELLQLRRRLDDELVAIMEEVLNGIIDASNEKDALIDTEADALFSFTSQMARLIFVFDTEVSRILGDVEGEAVTGALGTDATTDLSSTKERLIEQFRMSYRVQFTRWLRGARLRAERMVDNEIETIETRILTSEEKSGSIVVFSTRDLDLKLDEILVSGKDVMGLGRYTGDEYADAMETLKDHWTLRGMRLKQVNEQLLKKNRGLPTAKLHSLSGRQKMVTTVVNDPKPRSCNCAVS